MIFAYFRSYKMANIVDLSGNVSIVSFVDNTVFLIIVQAL